MVAEAVVLMKFSRTLAIHLRGTASVAVAALAETAVPCGTEVQAIPPCAHRCQSGVGPRDRGLHPLPTLEVATNTAAFRLRLRNNVDLGRLFAPQLLRLALAQSQCLSRRAMFAVR